MYGFMYITDKLELRKIFRAETGVTNGKVSRSAAVEVMNGEGASDMKYSLCSLINC